MRLITRQSHRTEKGSHDAAKGGRVDISCGWIIDPILSGSSPHLKGVACGIGTSKQCQSANNCLLIRVRVLLAIQFDASLEEDVHIERVIHVNDRFCAKGTTFW